MESSHSRGSEGFDGKGVLRKWYVPKYTATLGFAAALRACGPGAEGWLKKTMSIR